LRPYILFDAGGTLIFPDYPRLRQILLEYGYDVAESHLMHLMAEGIKQYDDALKNGKEPEEVPGFIEWLVEQVGVAQEHKEAVLKHLYQADVERSLWSYTYPWVYETLDRLSAQGHRMSVISNADGRVRERLESLDLADYFEEIFDSHLVGYAKPDPRLFKHALTALGLQPDECLFIGDVYMVDVLGANRMGIAAVHLDPYGLYSDCKGRRIRTIAQLPQLLADEGLDLQGEDFFPLGHGGLLT